VRFYIALVKWRNQLLALVCLIAFAGLGVLYFQHWVVQRPFGLVLLIGEGLGPERVAITRVYLGGADGRLAMDNMPNVALVKNYSRDFAVADQAAAATALATGEKVNNRSISIDTNGKALPTIVELARDSGRAVGLITDTSLTNPTCAAFYAHSNNASDREQLAKQFVEGGKIDIGLGASAAEFLPEAKHGRRKDNRDLLLELRRGGFDIVRNRADLEGIPAWRRPKLFGAFGETEPAHTDSTQNWGDEPSLSDMVRRAVELLQYNQRGYLLIVDAARMREAAETNNAEKTLAETAEFDRTLATVQRYAGGRSTIIACGDVALGGLHVNGYPFRKDSGIALLGLNPAGQPWITWATGPKGMQSYGAAKLPDQGTASPNFGSEKEQSQPAAFYVNAALPTIQDVPAFASGRGSEALHGTVDNTKIFKVLQDEL
jgi:alkaline phosphatase